MRLSQRSNPWVVVPERAVDALRNHAPTRSPKATAGKVKKVTDAGTFRFRHKLVYFANSLVDQHIGLEETDDGLWSMYFNAVLLVTLDERDYIIRGKLKGVTRVAAQFRYLCSRLLTRLAGIDPKVLSNLPPRLYQHFHCQIPVHESRLGWGLERMEADLGRPVWMRCDG